MATYSQQIVSRLNAGGLTEASLALASFFGGRFFHSFAPIAFDFQCSGLGPGVARCFFGFLGLLFFGIAALRLRWVVHQPLSFG